MRCPRCLTENPDRLKFCGECGSPLHVAPRRCARCGTANSPFQRFCGGCGSPVALPEGETAARGRPGTVPPGPHPRVTPGERKIVTVLFADLSGFTALSENMDPEELRDLMDGWFEVMGGVVRRHGGTIDKYIGDAVMALFGAPVAHEDDAERAIEAALAMHAALARMNDEVGPRIGKRLSIRIGINTGRVFAGYVGGEGDRSYTVMGDAVNVASRLETACPVGAVLVSLATYRHVRGLYDVRPLDPLHVKGKAEPVVAFEVLGRRSRSMRLAAFGTRTIETDLVGRDAELERVRQGFRDAVAERRPQLVVVAGEAGVGKTRLIRELAVTLDGRRELAALLRARCRPDGGAGPFQVLADALRSAADVAGGDSGRAAAEKIEAEVRAAFRDRRARSGAEPALVVASSEAEVDELVRLLCHAAGLNDLPLGRPAAAQDPRALFHATLEAARKWLTAIAVRGPVLLLVDDLHWAPDLTVDLIEHLLDAADLPLLVLSTLRSELTRTLTRWGRGPARARIQLEPLAPADAQRLAEGLLARLHPGSPRLVELVAFRGEGNPFFMEEIVSALLDDEVLVEDLVAGGWHLTRDEASLAELPVPDTVGKIIQARIDRLGAPAKLAIQRAAVCGPRFWPALLTMLARAEVEPGESGASGGWPLAGEEAGAVELDLAELLRAGLVTEAEGAAPGGGRAYQFRHALTREIVYESVVVRERRRWHRHVAESLSQTHAGGDAADRASLEQVAYHLLRAEEYGRAAVMLRRAGDAARAVWANRDARARYEEARDAQERAGAPHGERRDVLELLADVADLVGDYPAAVAACEQALALGQNGGGAPAAARARILVRLGRAHEHACDRDRARGCYEQAGAVLEAARAQTDGDPVELARVTASALQNLGWSHYLAGDLAGAETLYRRGLCACAGVDAPLEIAALENGLGALARARGDVPGALAAHRRALELRRRAGDRRSEATSHLNLGSALMQGGDYPTAREELEQALAIHEETGNAEGIGIACANLGAVALELGDVPAATVHLERALALAQRSSSWWAPECCRYLAEAMLRAGDVARAQALIDQGLSAGGGGQRAFEGSLLVVQGQLHARHERFAEAERAFAAALATLEAAEPGFELGVALYRFGDVARVCGRIDRAGELLARAHDLFRTVGNVTWRARAERALAELAGPQAPRV